MTAPLKKNDDITLEITGISSDGSGVGKIEGFAVFVPFTLAGETVRAHIIKVSGSYAVGKLLEVLVPSPDRVEPPCPYFGKCGGCSLMHIRYEKQLEYKRNVVRDALERIGGFNCVEVAPVIGMETPFRYRNKGSFPFADVDGSQEWGLYAQRSHRLIHVEDCLIEDRNAVIAANAVRNWAVNNRVSAYNELTDRGILRHVVTRTMSGGVSVTVVTTGKLPCRDKLVDSIRSAVPNVKSIVHNINPSRTNVILGEEFKVIWGNEAITESICGLDFSVSAESFLQVNHVQTEKLYGIAEKFSSPVCNEDFADLFCGIGTITLLLAKKAKSILGIEYLERAVSDARVNAELNGVTNAEFLSGAAEKLLPRLTADGRRFDVITLDPPRKGADEAVLNSVAASGAKRIVYVSCSPATLARDLKKLCGLGYEIQSVQPVDMFPHTAHVETVCCLYHQKKDFISVPYEPKDASYLKQR